MQSKRFVRSVRPREQAKDNAPRRRGAGIIVDREASSVAASGEDTTVARLPAPLIAREDYTFSGHMDFHGHHPRAAGWFVGGWIAHPWPLGRGPGKVTAVFDDMSMIECSLFLFHFREEIAGRGIGFLFYFPTATTPTKGLLSVLVHSGGTLHPLERTPALTLFDPDDLAGHLRGLVSDGEPNSHRHTMWRLLFADSNRESIRGSIDFHGHHESLGGWLLCGWVARGWREEEPPETLLASFEEGDIEGKALFVLCPRDDRRNEARGFVCFLPDEGRALGGLCAVSFGDGGRRMTLGVASATSRVPEAEMVARVRPLLNASSGPHRDMLLDLLVRQPYRGEDTLDVLSPSVFLEIDEAILAGSDGLVLVGWCLSLPRSIVAIRIRCGSLTSLMNLETCIRTDRPDVIEGFAQYGFSDPRCGFVAFLPRAVIPGTPLHMEIETTRHEIAYRALRPSRLEGIAAIKRLLSLVDVRYAEVRPAFDLVLGPAIERLNQTRLETAASCDVLEYGQAPAKPRFSVIVPLHGRLDYMEYQLALFSANPDRANIEYIYVLDDPPRRREARSLFVSVFERFQVPFTAVLLDRNVGYAPANNIGLARARGEFVAFVNSDVFPGGVDWLERLHARLTADPAIGVIGPMLLFENGSVQHRGMYFSRLEECGGFHFGLHHDKGLRPPRENGVEAYPAITGACMVMRRSLAVEMGGFDEAYILGDFEDTDLCLKLQARGYRCVVDPEVRLFHLERKSQESCAVTWRGNLTLYNAWRHDRLWAESIAARQR